MSDTKLYKIRIYQRYPRKNQYRCLIFIAMLYMMVGVCCPTLLGNKLVQTSFGIMSATSIVGTFWIIISDVIAEVYGFRMVCKIFFIGVFIEILFIVLCNFFVSMSSANSTKLYYNIFFHHALNRDVISSCTIIVAWYINTHLLLKWKILAEGKYFWLRSVSSSGIGIILFSLIMLPSWYFIGTVSNLKEASELAFWGATLKIIFIAFLAIPVSYLVKLLKIIEHSESNVENFTPFKQSQSEIIT